MCLLHPVDRIAPGAVRMQDLLAGSWDGVWHAPGAELLLDNAELWMSAVPVAGSVPDLGVKGATLRAVFGWRYPSGATLCARAQRPTPHQRSRPQYWDRWVAPLWGLRPITRYPGGGEWQPVPPVWAANPHRRIVLFEGLNDQGRDHTVGLSYTGQLWDMATAGGGGGGGGYAPHSGRGGCGSGSGPASCNGCVVGGGAVAG